MGPVISSREPVAKIIDLKDRKRGKREQNLSNYPNVNFMNPKRPIRHEVRLTEIVEGVLSFHS